MSKVKKILVAVDFSQCSLDALREAARIAAIEGATLKATHSVRVPLFTPLPEYGFTAEYVLDSAFVERARRRWERFKRDSKLDVDVTCSIDVGRPQDCIIDAASTEGADLVVLGAHGATDQWRRIGSVAVACLQRCPTPVLVVRQGHSGPFRSVLACVDFTETSRRALDEAMRIAARDDAALHVLHVYDDPWQDEDPPEEIVRNMPDFEQRYHEAIAARLKEFCGPMTRELDALKTTYRHVKSNDHGGEIVSYGRDHGCDLVALGTRSKWSVHDFLLGSTAERVVRDAPCSVLAIKLSSAKK